VHDCRNHTKEWKQDRKEGHDPHRYGREHSGVRIAALG
jgi:hypothetical protein